MINFIELFYMMIIPSLFIGFIFLITLIIKQSFKEIEAQEENI